MEPQIKKEPLNKKGFGIFVSENHTFGTDALLLADFAGAKKKDKAVDLGTGCGIIGFLFCRDEKCERVYGVDISDEAIMLCGKSVAENGLEDKFIPLCSDLNDLKGKMPFGENTLVTVNPPYKAPTAGIQNPDGKKRTARHEVACTLEDIIRVSSKLLQTSGRFCICHRPERTAELICLLKKYSLEPKRLRLVCQRTGEEPWLILVEAKKCAKENMRIEPVLYIEENGDYSEEMKRIYGDYKY